jgi:hypothetical protein
MASPTPAGSVADVYRAYSALMQSAAREGRPDLAHQLILCQPLSIAGEAPLVAAGIAAAAVLCIEPDSTAVRHSIRSGAIDFTVNNLDEALRALKNELRKGLSIAVCLEDDPEQILLQMAERGVQPELLCTFGEVDAGLAVFVEHGARTVDLGRIYQQLSPSGLIEASWHVSELPGKWLPMLDEAVASCLPVDDYERKNWLRRAPRYVGRPLRTKRYLPMTAAEIRCCEGIFQGELDGGPWKGLEVHFKSEPSAAAFHHWTDQPG